MLIAVQSNSVSNFNLRRKVVYINKNLIKPPKVERFMFWLFRQYSFNFKLMAKN